MQTFVCTTEFSFGEVNINCFFSEAPFSLNTCKIKSTCVAICLFYLHFGDLIEKINLCAPEKLQQVRNI